VGQRSVRILLEGGPSRCGAVLDALLGLGHCLPWDHDMMRLAEDERYDAGMRQQILQRAVRMSGMWD